MTKLFEKALRYGHVIQAYHGKVKYRLAEDYEYSPAGARVLAAILLEAADAAEFEPMFTEEQLGCLYDVVSSAGRMDPDVLVDRLRKIPKGNT